MGGGEGYGCIPIVVCFTNKSKPEELCKQSSLHIAVPREDMANRDKQIARLHPQQVGLR